MDAEEVRTNGGTGLNKSLQEASKGVDSKLFGRGDSDATLSSKVGEKEKVRVTISQVDLTSTMRPLNGLVTEISTQGLKGSMGAKMNKEKALREVTNLLEARPIKIKTSWSGSRLSGTKWAGMEGGKKITMGLLIKSQNLIYLSALGHSWAGQGEAGH